VNVSTLPESTMPGWTPGSRWPAGERCGATRIVRFRTMSCGGSSTPDALRAAPRTASL